jgi:protein TonB
MGSAVVLSLLAHAVVLAAVLHPWSFVVYNRLPPIIVTLVPVAPDVSEDRTEQATVADPHPNRPAPSVLALAPPEAVEAPAPPPTPPVKPTSTLPAHSMTPAGISNRSVDDVVLNASTAPPRSPTAKLLVVTVTRIEPIPRQQDKLRPRDVVALAAKMAGPVAEPTAHGPILDASLVADLQPEYPLLARRRGYQGRVVVAADVLSSGEVEFASLVASSGYDMLDDAALDAVRAWRLLPARKNGEAVDGTIEIPFDFVLQ